MTPNWKPKALEQFGDQYDTDGESSLAVRLT